MPQSFADQLRSIPMSPNLGQSLERAHRCARDQSHRLGTLEHLLLALSEDAEAALILQSANVDLARLGTDGSGYLGRLLEDMPAETGAEPGPREPAAGSESPTADRGSPIPEPMATQSADETLPAARTRIQKRASATAKTDPAILHDAPPDAPPEPTIPASLPMDADPPLETVDPVQAKSLTAAIEAAMASSHARGAEPLLPSTGHAAAVDRTEQARPAPVAPSELAATRPARATWTPPPEPRPQPAPARLHQPALARAPSPFPARPVQPNEGPRRPPLPPRATPHGQPQPGFPNRPPRAPWP